MNFRARKLAHQRYMAEETRKQTLREKHTEELSRRAREIKEDAAKDGPVHESQRKANTYSAILFSAPRRGKK